MACEIVEREAGLITVKISGRLKRSELAQAEKIAIESMRSGNKVRFLLITENFQGWNHVGEWGDLSFQARYDEQIEKIAIVGEKRWKELAEVFAGKGHRSVDIRYFTPDQAALARVWITQAGRGSRLMANRRVTTA
jgi:hypothetical protein